MTLLKDYECFVVPNSLKNTSRLPLSEKTQQVKCVCFLDDQGRRIASGHSDGHLSIWDSEVGSLRQHLHAHRGRIWSLHSTRSGKHLCTASSDGVVSLWDIEGGQVKVGDEGLEPLFSWSDNQGSDVYCVRLHPGEQHLTTAGYDKAVRLYDMRTGSLLRAFVGHTAAGT